MPRKIRNVFFLYPFQGSSVLTHVTAATIPGTQTLIRATPDASLRPAKLLPCLTPRTRPAGVRQCTGGRGWAGVAHASVRRGSRMRLRWLAVPDRVTVGLHKLCMIRLAGSFGKRDPMPTDGLRSRVPRRRLRALFNLPHGVLNPTIETGARWLSRHRTGNATRLYWSSLGAEVC